MAVQAGSIYVSLSANVRPFASNMQQAVNTVSASTQQIKQSVGVAERHVNSFWGSVGGGNGFRPYSLIAVSRAFDNAADRAGLLRGALLATTGAFGGFTAALTSNLILRYADSFTKLYNQVRAVSSSTEDASVRFDALSEVATRSRSSLEATAVLYSRIQKAIPEEAPANILQYVETIQKALALGGATAQESRSAAIQFSQAIASNKLGGDELRAVLETPLGLELAKGLHITIGELRQMSVQGRLTASTVLQGIGSIREEIENKWKNTIVTTDQALTHLDNQLTLYFGSLNKAYGATSILIGGINAVGENLNTILPILGKVGLAIAAVFLSRAISGGVGAIVRPFTDSLAAARTQAEQLGSRVKDLRKNFLDSALAVQQLKNKIQAAQGNFIPFAVQSKQAAVGRAAVSANANPSIGNLAQLSIAATEAQANGQARLQQQMAALGAQYRLTRAELQSTISLQQEAVAASGRMRVAWNGLRATGASLVSFLGGPWGIAIAALSLGIENYLSTQRKQSVAIDEGIKAYEEYANAADKAASSTKTLDDAQANTTVSNIKGQIESVTEAIGSLEAGSTGGVFGIISPEVISQFNELKQSALTSGGQIDKLKDKMNELRKTDPRIGPDIDLLIKASFALQGLIKKYEQAKKAKEDLSKVPFVDPETEAVKGAEKRAQDLAVVDRDRIKKAQQELEVARLQVKGLDDLAEATKQYYATYDEFTGHAGVNKAAKIEEIRQSVATKRALDEETASIKRREAAQKQFAETLERMQEENKGAFLGDTDRFVLQQLRQKRATSEEIEAYVKAANSGNFSLAPSAGQDLRNIRLVAQAGQEARGIVDQYGTLSQLMPRIIEQQEILNIAVQNGAITAGQAAIQFNNFITKFGNYKWITQASDAIGQFAETAILDFKNIGQAASQLVQRLAQIALQAALIDPFLKPGISSVISTVFGLPSFGKAGAGVGGTTGGISGPGGASFATQHSGGVAGQSRNFRTVSSSVFGGAPRFHKGLYSGEFPAILKKGERVLTAQMDRRVASTIAGLSTMRGAAAPVVQSGDIKLESHIHFNGPPPDDPAKIDELTNASRRSLEAMMDDRLARSTKPRGILNRAI